MGKIKEMVNGHKEKIVTAIPLAFVATVVIAAIAWGRMDQRVEHNTHENQETRIMLKETASELSDEISKGLEPLVKIQTDIASIKATQEVRHP